MSRRPLAHPIARMVKAQDRMAPGGRVWSESPIPGGYSPRVPMGGEDVAAPANPWPPSVWYALAVSTTPTSATWTYDPHPELITSVRVSHNVVGSGTGRTLRVRADGGGWTVTQTLQTTPGSSSLVFTLPTPVHMATLTVEWSPSTVVDTGSLGAVPEWT